MSNTRCEIMPWIVVALEGVIIFTFIVPKSAMALLYILTVVTLAWHIHYGTCVVRNLEQISYYIDFPENFNLCLFVRFDKCVVTSDSDHSTSRNARNDYLRMIHVKNEESKMKNF